MIILQRFSKVELWLSDKVRVKLWQVRFKLWQWNTPRLFDKICKHRNEPYNSLLRWWDSRFRQSKSSIPGSGFKFSVKNGVKYIFYKVTPRTKIKLSQGMNYHVEQVSPSGNIILVALLSISRLERQATTVRREGSKDDYFLVFQIPIYILLIKKIYI